MNSLGLRLASSHLADSTDALVYSLHKRDINDSALESVEISLKKFYGLETSTSSEGQLIMEEIAVNSPCTSTYGNALITEAATAFDRLLSWIADMVAMERTPEEVIAAEKALARLQHLIARNNCLDDLLESVPN